ncbi:MAG: hypothetical protein GTO13_16510 [Proteobacteria bacterium]|nr:hypothetical protein [Pseudomonadota bacterium]
MRWIEDILKEKLSRKRSAAGIAISSMIFPLSMKSALDAISAPSRVPQRRYSPLPILLKELCAVIPAL